MKYLDKIEDMPIGVTCYVGTVFGKITIPADQRSIDCPGHGYPAHQVTATKFILFDNKQEMQEWYKQNERQWPAIMIGTYLRAKVETQVVFS